MKLEEESCEMGKQIEEVIAKGKDLEPELSPMEKVALDDNLARFKSSYEELAQEISNKVNQIRQQMANQQDVTRQLEESSQELAALKRRVTGLNRPVGWTPEDAQDVLQGYQVSTATILFLLSIVWPFFNTIAREHPHSSSESLFSRLEYDGEYQTYFLN